MEIVFLGVNNFGWEIYDWLCDRDSVTVRALLTEPDQLDLIKKIEPDIVLASGFGAILPEDILEIPEHGCINVHPGYLPNLRGYNPNVWSIVEAEPAGVSIHQMEPSVDAGGILARREVETSFADTGKTLYKRLEEAAVDLFIDTWPKIEDDSVDPVPQNEAEAGSHRKKEFIDICEIDPDEHYTAKELLDILRALTYPPFDNAYVELEGTKYFVEVNISEASKADETDGFTSGY
jgi:methionyl-tRNA formyltransferase